jgi:transcriptional regulator with XRE-family HTH domain
LERLSGGPLTFGEALEAVREREALSQVDLAERMGISRSHLCDLEKGRKLVSPGLAAEYARVLRHSESQFVRLALQDQLARAGLKLVVRVDAA